MVSFVFLSVLIVIKTDTTNPGLGAMFHLLEPPVTSKSTISWSTNFIQYIFRLPIQIKITYPRVFYSLMSDVAVITMYNTL